MDQQQQEHEHDEVPTQPSSLPPMSEAMGRASRLGKRDEILHLLLEGENPDSLDDDHYTAVLLAANCRCGIQ
jgi:hypothetical protein